MTTPLLSVHGRSEKKQEENKMKKTALAILTTAALVLGLAGCGGNAAPSSSAQPSPAPAEAPASSGSSQKASTPAQSFTIGFSFPTSNNEFWQNAVNFFKMSSADLQFTPLFDDCNGDTAEQLADVETMISSGINGLVLAPQDASVVPGILGACKEKNIPVVIIDRLPDSDIVPGEDFVAFVGPNDQEAGYQEAVALFKAGVKNLVAVGGIQGTSVASGRNAGLEKALAEYPDVTLLQMDWAGENWDDGDKSFRNMYSAHPELDGVWCYNDSLALSSVNVLTEAGKVAEVKVGGMDCLSDAVASMEAGQLYFSCGGHYMMPAMAATILYDTLNGITYDGVANVQLNLLNVTTENVAKFRQRYLDNPEPIDWTQYSKAYNPDVKYSFETMLSMD